MLAEIKLSKKNIFKIFYKNKGVEDGCLIYLNILKKKINKL